MIICPNCRGHSVLVADGRRAACRRCGARWVEDPAFRKALRAGHPCVAHLLRPMHGVLLPPG